MQEAGSLKQGMRESDIQRVIRDYLKLHGWYVWKNQQSALSHKGVSDLTAVKKGVTLWIEIKTGKGRQSKHQAEFEKNIKEQQGHYLVARSFEDVDNYLSRIAGGKINL